MVTRSVVQSAMHTAATALAHLPPEEWAGWIAYLCEALEGAAQGRKPDAGVEAALREAVALLEARLEREHW